MSLTLPLFSQENVVIQGVLKSENGKNVVNASIFIPEFSKGTTSDKNGRFILKAKQETFTLFISHIKYYSKTLSVAEIEFKKSVNDTIKLTINLKEKTNQLAAFEISAEKIQMIYNKAFVTILDYQFYQDKMILLSKGKKFTSLKLVKLDGVIIDEIKVSNSSTFLHKDCFGNIHLIDKDSAFQIMIEPSKMKIIYATSTNTFELFLKPCISNLKNTFIFKQEEIKKQTILYYYVDKNKKAIILKKITDKLGQVYASERAASIKKMHNPELSVMSESKKSVRDARGLAQTIMFLDILLKNLIKNPLFVIDNNVYIFDHTNNTCWVFDENLSNKKTFALDYQFQKSWDKELIVDEELGEVYAKFEKGGLCYLKKIDLQTGKIIESYKLEKHTFPTNIKIRNREAYYLYEDHFNHGQMSLYKQGLY